MENRLKQIRIGKKMTLADVAKRADTTPQQIHKLEKGQRGIDTDWLERLSKALGVSPAEILGLQTDGISLENVNLPEYHYKPIPIISWVQAGELTEIMKQGCFEDFVISTKKTSQYTIALIVVGDSMEPRFQDGDVIIIDPEVLPQIGDFCVAIVDNEATFKVFYKNTDEHIILKPLNSKRSSILIEKNNGNEFRFVGKVVDMKPKL